MIDIHTHIAEREHFTPEFAADMEHAWAEVDWDGYSPARHWAAMADVDRAVVLALDAPATGMVVPNEYVAAYVNQHPDRLVGFASVDPNRPDAIERLDHAVDALGLRGLKLGPIYQHFDPTGDAGMAVFKHAAARGLPVLIHQGTTFVRDGPLEFARPISLDEVARRCPDLVLIVAHLGHPWCEETMVVIRKHPNLYTDVSALHTRPFQLYEALVSAMEYRVLDKLVFGSDFPMGGPTAMREALLRVNDIAAGTGMPRIPDAALTAIVERDSLRLIGIDAPA